MENSKSMLSVAYDILSKSDKPISFFDLFNAVAKELGMTEEVKKAKISQFYTNLSLDGDFVVLSDNTWELRDRVPFEKVHIDMNDAYLDKDDDDEDGDESDGDDTAKELGEDDDAPSASEDTFTDDESSTDDAGDDKEEEVKKELGV